MHHNFEGVKVMVIDDSKTIRRTAEILLSKEGIEVITAIDGFDALAKIADSQPAIIFVDTMMPRLDGYQTCALIKNNVNFQKTPVIMLSSKDSLFDPAKGRIVGSDRYLTKPFSKDEILAYLNRLNRKQEGSEKNYLPAVNNLRPVPGEKTIQGLGAEQPKSEGPDLAPLKLESSGDSVNAYVHGGGEGNLTKIRARYQHCLGAILKKNQVRKNLTTIGKLLTTLAEMFGDSPAGNMVELGLGVVEGVAKGGIKLNKQTATRLRQINDHLKLLTKAGQEGLSTPVDEELAIGLIKLISESKKETKRISALRQRYEREAPEPEAFATGPDDETMSAVALILIEEVNSVSDKLGLLMRAQNKKTGDLVSLLPPLEQISRTMIVLGYTEPQLAVASQVSIIKELETSDEPSEGVLLNMAQALLEIAVGLGPLVVASKEKRKDDSSVNLDEAHAVVIRETRIGLSAAKDSVIGFIASEFDHAKIVELPQVLNALRGGMISINQLQAADVLKVAASYVADALINASQAPELVEMDDLADAITSVDYYLEKLLDNPSDPYFQMLEVAEIAVEKLGYAVGAEAVVEGRKPSAIPATAASEPEALEESFEPEELVFTASADSLGHIEKDSSAWVETSTIEAEEKLDSIALNLVEVDATPTQESPAEAVFQKLTVLPVGDNHPIFLEETDVLLTQIVDIILNWPKSVAPGDNLANLLTLVYALKNSARHVGAVSLGEYAHHFETFLIGIQNNPIEQDDEFFAELNKRQQEVIRRVSAYKKLSFGTASNQGRTFLKSALEPALEKDRVQALYTATDYFAPVEPQRAIKGTSKKKGVASASQEMIRVSDDLLQELIGLAGESSISRVRVEQKITDFGEYLKEMEETINLITDHVGRLELEAESRETLIRSRPGEESDSGADGIEMDRRTMVQATSRALSKGASDMMVLKDTLDKRIRDAETLLHQQARISSELQEGLIRTRIVPFSNLLDRLRRIVRQVSSEVGKSVRFDADNVEGGLDRNVLEKIVAPLEHMLRNAVDHGIEDEKARVASGKKAQGRISLRLSREGGYVVLTISDDGGGIDVNAVRAKAIERGLITEGQDVPDHEVMQFIMHAGFSTAQKLTQISGRGVGMDVVGSEIKALGGSLAIDSTLGVGTEFTIRIPFTVSISRALIVVVKKETYAIPLNTIEGIVRVIPYELEAYYHPDAPMFEYAGKPYKLDYIGKMLGKMDDPNLTGQVVPLPVILARSGDHAVALQVDRVIDSREVVLKTLGAQPGDVGGISGATVLGDDSVVIILDCMELVRSYEASVDAPTVPVVTKVVVGPVPIKKIQTVMIVDDSITARKVTSRLMEKQGFAVVTAKNSVDAMSRLQSVRPDVVLVDIKMPRMDGFEVLRSVRRDEKLKGLPIVMITSKAGKKHKQQAMMLGVNKYLGKPFREAKLLAAIGEVIESAKVKPERD